MALHDLTYYETVWNSIIEPLMKHEGVEWNESFQDFYNNYMICLEQQSGDFDLIDDSEVTKSSKT